jgi:hypothetical protein
LALQNAKEAESEQMEMIENENDVITFKLKYLGSTVVEKMTGDNISTEAVKNIIKVTKAGRKKLQRVHIAISLKGIVVTDLEGNDILKISIYRSVSSPSSAPELTCPIAESRIVRRIPPTGKYSLSSRPTPTRPWSATLSSVRKERWRRR